MNSTSRADVIKMCDPLRWQKEGETGSRLIALKEKKKKRTYAPHKSVRQWLVCLY